MKRQILASLAALIAATAAGAAQAASDGLCKGAVTGEGRSSHVEGSDDWDAFHGKVPDGLAKSRAIEAWSATVKSRCPRSSPLWWRAADRSVECEGTPGHTNCTATATPAHKVMSYLGQ